MNPDLVNQYLVKIKCQSSLQEGTGVLVKATADSKFVYILTAKHLFFKDKEYENHLGNSLEFSLGDVLVYREKGRSHDEIIFRDSLSFRAWFVKNDTSIDLAILIADISSVDNFKLKPLSVFDTRAISSGGNYILAGYPSINDGELQKYKMIYHSDNTIPYVETFECDTSAMGSLPEDFVENLNGLSGGGIFLISSNDEVYLRGVEFKARHTSMIDCIKLDEIIEELNESLLSIKEAVSKEIILHAIETSQRLSINGNKFDFDKMHDFDFLGNQVDDEIDFEGFLKSNKIDFDYLGCNKAVLKSEKILDEWNEKVLEEVEEISFLYAKLGMLAHKNYNSSATNRNFSKAVEVNPKHKQLLLLEQLNRKGDISQLAKIRPRNISEVVRKNKFILGKVENNDLSLIECKEYLMSAIVDADDFLDESNKNSVDEVVFLLEKKYFNEDEIKDKYKYIELARFYKDTKNFKMESIYNFNISKEILNLSPKTELNDKLFNEVENSLAEFKERFKLDIGYGYDEVREIAREIFKKEEDQTVREMLSTVHDQVLELKFKDEQQDRLLFDMKRDVFALEDHSKISYQAVSRIEKKVTNVSENIALLDAIEDRFNAHKESIEKGRQSKNDKRQGVLLNFIKEAKVFKPLICLALSLICLFFSDELVKFEVVVFIFDKISSVVF